MSQILKPYEIPLAYADLSPDEIILDAIHSLTHLSTVIDDMFNKIEKRISDEKSRLSNINSRVANCLHKVNQIKGTNRAITIFSTAKYPALRTRPYYVTLTSQASQMPNTYREADSEIYTLSNPVKSIVGNSDLNAEVLAIMSRLNSYDTDMTKVEFIIEDQGLGVAPDYIPTVGSLLLFNSDINPYREYKALDNLVSAGKTKTTEDDSKQAMPASASLLTSDMLPDIEALDLTFKPAMQEISSLQLPANLPLDFLADISYSAGPTSSIAPSANAKPSNMQEMYFAAPKAKEVTSLPPAPSSTPAGPPVSQVSMPPPPMETVSLPSPPIVETNIPVPVVAPTETVVPTAVNPVNDASMEEDNFDAPKTSSIFDDIKNMSINKLRSRDESAQTATKFQKKEAPKPMSLQDDLKARLQRRHGQLSGKSDKEQQEREAAIVKAAREDASPISKSFSSKPKKFDDDDNESVLFTKPLGKSNSKVKDDLSDTDESEISDVSLDESVIVAPPRPKFVPPAAVERAQPIKPKVPVPETPVAANEGGGTLLDSRQVTGMLSKAQQRANDSDSDDDDDWD